MLWFSVISEEASVLSLPKLLRKAVEEDPIRLVEMGIFLLAILHTFLTPSLHRLAEQRLNRARRLEAEQSPQAAKERVAAELLLLLGEVEVVFGLWVIPLFWILVGVKGWAGAIQQLEINRNFAEPLFVVAVMTAASSRPILLFLDQWLQRLAALGRESVAAWWFSLLTLGALAGSLVTEPGAMTVTALLLGKHFFALGPRPALSYATVGLLFTNVSIGGCLTHFAAPPVIMAAHAWGWGSGYMLVHFGAKAAAATALGSLVYRLVFRKEFARLETLRRQGRGEEAAGERVPPWITGAHLAFLVWIVATADTPVLCVGGLLFFLGFLQVTGPFQDEVSLRRAVLVGFFLAGLEILGSLQSWWISPLLERLGDTSLLFSASVITAFNDNALVTYLASLVPSLPESSKQAVMAGAVAAGGLTVIANAPNPAGQALLSRFFPDGISPLGLAAGALVPTAIALMLLRL
ncbi:putative Na+/H+ antiporter [Verrucomicrobium sp. 3C]|uniref:putative Na+/H+ antiporter n=1 Tax=Verrucomicrobium sp. 3C TaxID=1134055 RepID=UPI00036E0236|nr:putative Na+/H+ antiporter [Verrucomicrobium sp. 3C]